MFYEGDISLPVVSRGESPIGFSDLGFPLFETRDSGFERIIGASFEIESMHRCTGGGMPKITLGILGRD